jgi:flavin reductase (DIM6/NTAB) family NADH-FMN oxidoreductase RutF
MKSRGSSAERGEHLVFLWSSSGYALEVRFGAPPATGATIENGTGRYRVAKTGRSPLPGDSRICAYLLPVGVDAAALPEDAGVAEAVSDVVTLLGELPEGQCVVAVDAEGRRQGLTVSTLVSLSLDPPLVGFAVGNDEMLLELLPDAGGCAISLLAGGQEWLADHFTGGARPIAMWHGLAAEEGAAGAPLFVGALGWLECSLRESIPVGSHTFCVCEVRRIEAGSEAPALLESRGSYRSI